MSRLSHSTLNKWSISLTLPLLFFTSCQSDQETITPENRSITESVYASGVVVSKNQYQVFATVSGIVDEVFADEGDTVNVGTPILSIINEAQQLMADNAKLSAEFNALKYNRGKIDEAKSLVDLAKSQLDNDSSMYERQKNLWAQSIGSKVEFERKELAFKNSKASFKSAKEKLDELERQLSFASKQAQNNFLISNKNTGDYLLKSKVKGKVYQMNLTAGEIVTPQLPIAIIGDDRSYLLEMQVDEYDIVTIELGMPVLIVLNSYRDSVFNAVISKINPIMNVQSKTFTVEADFTKPPKVLYPNISFEANIVINTKEDALLIPRSYMLNDSTVINKEGKELTVKTGLKDYQKVEILSGLDATVELILPE